MLYLIDVPDDMTPDNFNRLSVMERELLIQAFRRAKKGMVIDNGPIHLAAFNFYATDNFTLFVTD